MLFSEEFGGARDEMPVEMIQLLELDAPPDYALELVRGVRSSLEELDERIGSASHHWRVERMSLIDRNVIRLGTYEILHVEEVTTAVAINEAIEIARRYGDTDSWSFVNGVLDAVARESR
jgi:N utilization substance protein B